MSFDDKVEVVVSWEALLKQSPVYESTCNIYSGKAHKAPPLAPSIPCCWILSASHGRNTSSMAPSRLTISWCSRSCVMPGGHLHWMCMSMDRTIHGQEACATARPLGSAWQQEEDSSLFLCGYKWGGSCVCSQAGFQGPQCCLQEESWVILQDEAHRGKQVHPPSHAWPSAEGSSSSIQVSLEQVDQGPSACPCCGHSFTMPVESQANVNAMNRKQCTKASANGGGWKVQWGISKSWLVRISFVDISMMVT